MRINHSSKRGESRRPDRKGILYLGAVPEVAVISIAVCVCFVAMSQANSLLQWHSSAQTPRLGERAEHPIFSLDYDRDQQRLLSHSWRSEFDEIDLKSATVKTCRKPQHLLSAATSARNSTTVFLSEWTSHASLRHEICVVRNEELLLMEELDFGVLTSGEVRISADGTRVLVVTHDGQFWGWDLSSTEPTRWQFRVEKSTFATQLSPDGQHVFVALADGGCVICDARRGTVEKELTQLTSCPRSVAWSADGCRVAVGDQAGEIAVFDAATAEEVWRRKLDMLFARSLALSDDGSLLVAGGFEKTIWFWDLSRKSDPPKTFEGESSVVHDLVFIEGNTRLISGGQDGTIREWDVGTQEMIRRLR